MTVVAPAPPRERAVWEEATLDAALASAWAALSRHADATCVVCGGRMQPQYAAGALPIGGWCEDCGSRLS